MENIQDPEKIKNIEAEYLYLLPVVEQEIGILKTSQLYIRLLETNRKLWRIEDDIRDKERERQFDSEFVELARLVYITNDERAKIKKEINLQQGSKFIEEKSYQEY
jgi:hypothetical protein